MYYIGKQQYLRRRLGGCPEFHAFQLALLQLPCEAASRERQLCRWTEFQYPKHVNRCLWIVGKERFKSTLNLGQSHQS